MLVPSAAVVKQFVQISLHKLLERVGSALESEMQKGREYHVPDSIFCFTPAAIYRILLASVYTV